MSSVDTSMNVTAAPFASPGAPAAAAPADDGFSFGDLLDVVNPLQHIPVVSTIYRAITGDEIKTLPKIAGDTLFGGVVGLIASVADTVFENVTGKNVGDTVLAMAEKEIAPARDTTDAPSRVTHMGFGGQLVAWVEDLVSPDKPATNEASSNVQMAATHAPAALMAPPATVLPASLDTILIPGGAAVMTALTNVDSSQHQAARAAATYQATLDFVDEKVLSPLH